MQFWTGCPLLALAALVAVPWTCGAEARSPGPHVLQPRVCDALTLVQPDAVHVEGWLGCRIHSNLTQRLLQVDLDPLLAGYRHRPGNHPWIGEHIGKWLHAATLAWAYSGEPALRARLDQAVTDLLRTQEPDGYLGTYTPEHRFGLYPGADWDVWSHKYNLIGLLTYHEYTGHGPALEACRRMADLLLDTFPRRKSILAAGTHMGMAATSVLEPIVLLYRRTGEERYLAFARYIVRAWEEPDGPRILGALLTHGRVHRTANAKAYELLSNLAGLCELYRVTGESDYLRAVEAAWEDVVLRRLYVTGGASQGEYFREDHELPNHEAAHVAETCVTVTWLQLNLQLLRLTGRAQYAREVERTLYNHLTAAQHPSGRTWCYFTPLEGRKTYGPGINCCVSSGPRGLALAPLSTYGVVGQDSDAPEVAVMTFETSRAHLAWSGGGVTVVQQSGFPTRGVSRLTFRLEKPTRFGLRVHSPDWAGPVRLYFGGRPLSAGSRDGWTEVPARFWKDGDTLEMRFRLEAVLLPGKHGNQGRAALSWGPFVLACESPADAALPSPFAVGWKPPVRGSARWQNGGRLLVHTRSLATRGGKPLETDLVTFADAGSEGAPYRVWLWGPDPGWQQRVSALAEGSESRSRPGNQSGSILDGDPGSVVVTYDGRWSVEDWFAVSLPGPVRIRRVIFRHGRTFHDGGWFDTSQGKPRVQVRRTVDGPWETVGVLDDYPATSATDAAGLRGGEAFELRLAGPVEVVAVRVAGRPACGDNPAQAFSSCAELEAFEE